MSFPIVKGIVRNSCGISGKLNVFLAFFLRFSYVFLISFRPQGARRRNISIQSKMEDVTCRYIPQICSSRDTMLHTNLKMHRLEMDTAEQARTANEDRNWSVH
jgi:hypothetical protein